MTAGPPIRDIALDSVLAASPDPEVPTDLADRVTAAATAKPQRRLRGPFIARRARRARRRAKMRRPIILGTIGGGLLAASAVAADLATDGSFDLARITKPVVELFVPEPPIETVSVDRPVRDTQRPAASVDADIPTPVTDRTAPGRRLGWQARELRRAFALQQLLERYRQQEVGVDRSVPRLRRAQAAAARAARLRTADNPIPVSRMPAGARTGSAAPILRQRIDAIRNRRSQVDPVVPNRLSDAQRGRIVDALRNRQISAPPRLPFTDSSRSPAVQTGTMPEQSATVVQGGDLIRSTGIPEIRDNTPPGPEPAQLPQIQTDLPAAEPPVAANARRAAILERLRAAQAAQRARAAQRVRDAAQRRTPPPRRPRIPRRPR